MNSGLHKGNLTANRLMVEGILKRAEYVILMDADIDHRTFYMLSMILPDVPIHLHHNTQLRSEKLTVYQMNEYQFDIQLYSSIAMGLNCHVVTSSKKKGDRLDKSLRDMGIIPLYLHSAGDEHDEIVKDLDNKVKNYQVFMHTSTINVGIDISTRHFHRQFVYGSRMSNCVRELCQMMDRVRYLEHNTVYCCLDMRGGGRKPVEHLTVRGHIIEKLNKNSSLVTDFLDGTEQSIIWVKDRPIWELNDNKWTWLYIEEKRGVNISVNWYEILYERTLVSRGAEYIKVPSIKIPRQYQDVQKALRQSVDEEKKQMYRTIDIPPPDVIRQIEYRFNNGYASKEDKFILKKRWYLSHFREDFQPTITAEQWFTTEINTYQLIRHQEEVENPIIDILLQDLFRDGVHQDIRFNRCRIIRMICQWLGVNHSYDTSCEVPGERVRMLMGEFLPYIADIRTLFDNNRKTVIKDFRQFLIFLNGTVLGSWSGSRLKSDDKPKQSRVDGRVKHYIYHLTVPKEMEEVYPGLKPIRTTPFISDQLMVIGYPTTPNIYIL